MAIHYKILIIWLGFALSNNLWAQSQGDSMQKDINPLKIDRDGYGAVFYRIDDNALDQIDVRGCQILWNINKDKHDF